MTTGISRLAGKVALVTGAAQGIGQAIAARLAEEGAKVAIADIQDESAASTAAELKSAGLEASAIKLDVTSLDSAVNAVAAVERALGPVDILINNAGWDKLEPFVDSTPETWDRVIAINFRGVLNCCKAVIPGMQARGGGKIVSISSDAGRVGSLGEAVYSGCKAGRWFLSLLLRPFTTAGPVPQIPRFASISSYRKRLCSIGRNTTRG